MFAERLHWPHYVTDECDADFIDEMIEFWDAQATHEEEKKAEGDKDKPKIERKRKLYANRRQNYGPSMVVDLNGNSSP